jgi:hypothetical protein
MNKPVSLWDIPIVIAELSPLLNMVTIFIILSFQLRKHYRFDYNINKKTMNYIFFFEVGLVGFIWG